MMPGMAAPDAPLRVMDDGPASGGRASARRRGSAGRPGRAMLAVTALVLGIGSCQLPQPPLPKLTVDANGGLGVVAAAGAQTAARGDRT